MTRNAGHFGWHDLNTHDEATSEAFYSQLFGWSVATERSANGYRPLSNQGVEFGGIFPMSEEMEVPNNWAGYIIVDDLDDINNRAKTLGGWYPFEEMPILGIGRFSVVFDPTGAPVTAFEPTAGNEFDNLGTGGTGSTVIWNELITTDIASSVVFHRDLYGWEFDDGSYAAGAYLIARVNGTPVAGLYQPMPGPAHSTWITYFNVTDARASAERAAELGATIIHQPTEVPGVGVTAWLNDPPGATFGLMQPAEGWFERLRKPAAKGE